MTLLSWKVNMSLLDHCGRHETQPHIISWQSIEIPGRKEGRVINPGVEKNQDEVYKLPIHSRLFKHLFSLLCALSDSELLQRASFFVKIDIVSTRRADRC